MLNNKQFNFKDLFVLDIANNHQGDLDHATAIIKNIGKIAKENGVRGVFKFQFRQLDTFIHSSHKLNSSNKHIPRFLSTKLEIGHFKKLLDIVHHEGMLSMCTPFDEESVELIEQMKFDLIKVASCSAKDWPLLERITQSNLPIVCSTGGLGLENIDDLVSFFEHRGSDYAIMHCVSLYPIPDEKFHLNQIDVLKRRYPDKTIGWSTHEKPNLLEPIIIAVSKGAEIFEKHVGIPKDGQALNLYSANPDEVDAWIKSALYAKKLCGSEERTLDLDEVDALDGLRRGVYLRRDLKKGSVILRKDVYFAMPYIEGQLESGLWKENISALENMQADAPVMVEKTSMPPESEFHVIKKAIHEVKALLNEAKVILNSEFDVEYSHHYGLSKFKEFGVVIINVINREYCKKILVQLPGQSHPAHFHKLKEETFQVLSGELDLHIDGKLKKLYPGETCLVLPGVWHSFSTNTGCVVEEISTTHYNNDSIYKDQKINQMERSNRKTKVDHWGRWQMSEFS